ncbi:MAG: hypothetical protein JW986_02970 [Methanotrichaceae archaeon]|nr:hypothetical protein [Methanotrichaceae archaeon]
MAVMLLFLVVVQILALAMMPALLQGEVRVFEDPESAANPIGYLFLILIFTAFLLLVIRLNRGWVIGGFISLAVGSSIYYVLDPFIPRIVALFIAVSVMVLLRIYPEWYVVDIVGLVVSAGISALFGISMTVLPALILLAALAAYDFISVYKTKHMVALAESAIKIRAPLLFIVPRRRDYSFRREGNAGNEGKGAYFLGLGDAIIPTILVISANWSLSSPSIGAASLTLTVPALSAMIGTYIGFGLLMTTSRDRPQAGLPFLNGGAIAGFLLGWAALVL